MTQYIYSDTTNNQEVPPLNSSTASFLQQHEEHQEEQQHDQHQRQQPHQDEVVAFCLSGGDSRHSCTLCCGKL